MDWPSPSLDPLIAQRLLETVLLLAAALLLTEVGRRLALHTFDDQERQYKASKWLGRVFWGIALVLIVAIWSPSATNLITLLTIIGAGLAVALRDVLLSFVGWIHLSLHPPYRQGDRIEVNEVQGDVVDIGLTQTTLLEVGEWVGAHQSTGRLLHVPNAWIYQYGVKNYTEGFGYLWLEQSVVVTFNSNWKAARDLILEIAEEKLPNIEHEARKQLRQMTSEYLVQLNVLTPYVYVSIADQGVRLTLRHLTSARGRRDIRHDLSIEVLRQFQARDDIHIAYPTYSVDMSDTAPRLNGGATRSGSAPEPPPSEASSE